MGDAPADNQKCPASLERRRGPTGCASRLKHALNASVHFFFFDKFTSRNLVNANLNLRFEPFIMSKQLGNGFLHQVVSSSACLGGKLIQLDFLILRQMYFHPPRVGGHLARVKSGWGTMMATQRCLDALFGRVVRGRCSEYAGCQRRQYPMLLVADIYLVETVPLDGCLWIGDNDVGPIRSEIEKLICSSSPRKPIMGSSL